MRYRVFEDAVYVGRDAQVTLEASREMLQPGEGSAEHYRTTHLVGTAVTKFCVNPAAAFSSDTRAARTPPGARAADAEEG